MSERNLGLYSFLSRLPIPKSYVGKIMLVAFLGIHVPLLTLIFYLVLSSDMQVDAAFKVTLITLVSTLIGTGITLYLLYLLVSPVSIVSDTLREYIEDKKHPELPTNYNDEMGRLMANVQFTIKHVHRLIGSLEETSMTDYLTGAYNRLSAEKRLQEDISRVNRTNIPLSLVILDIDNFKQINDHHGHKVGDSCLRHIVHVIDENIRDGDWIARWGGDEFVMVLFGCGERVASKTLARIFEVINGNPLPGSLGNIENFSLSISAGISEYDGESSSEEILRKADSALLRAKELGKSRIMSYGDVSESRNKAGKIT